MKYVSPDFLPSNGPMVPLSPSHWRISGRFLIGKNSRQTCLSRLSRSRGPLMPYLAVMQGRLVPPEGGHFQSFPRERWQDEFGLAAEAGLNGIEWIFDVYGEGANPLACDEGIAEMRALSEKTGIVVRSLCADYFIDRPFLRTTQSEREKLIQKMEWLLARCRIGGISRVVIPFVDRSRIENEDDKIRVLSILRTLLRTAETNRVEVHLETSLA